MDAETMGQTKVKEVPEEMENLQQITERLSNKLNGLEERLQTVLSSSESPPEAEPDRSILTTTLGEGLRKLHDILCNQEDAIVSILDRLEL